MHFLKIKQGKSPSRQLAAENQGNRRARYKRPKQITAGLFFIKPID
jgi:hypothetical protein